MALIKCKECGKEISDSAEICPNCGYITQYGSATSEKKQISMYTAVGAIELLIGILAILLNFGEFIDKFPNLGEYYKYFSDESKAAIWIFVVGILLAIFGVGNLASAVSKVSKIQEREINEYMEMRRRKGESFRKARDD